MFFYFRLIPNITLAELKNPNDPSCGLINAQTIVLEKIL